MRILVSWLRDFVDVPVSIDQLARDIGMRGFEVAGIEQVEEHAGASAGGSSDDAVIDFEITANRPDCLSVLGIAREVAAAYDLPLRFPAPGPLEPETAAAPALDGTAAVTVVLEDPDLCPRYAAATANVAVGASPDWLRRRLEAGGIRAINSIVDVTNYVLLEIGQPMHAFDLARLSGQEVRIRRARPGESLRTLDGVDRSLTPDMLVIADAERPVAIAGVMGGQASEVTSATRAIVLESAYFNPLSVRRTSRRLGLKTEASARFERGADIDAPTVGIERARALFQRIGAGAPAGPLIDRYPAPRSRIDVPLRQTRIARILGHGVESRASERILERLGFIVSRREHEEGAVVWSVGVPSWRVDVTREADLIEEVGRHYGYDRLPSTFPSLRAATAPPDPRIARDRLVRQVLLGSGFSEAVTFAFIERAAAEAWRPDDALVPVANPLSEKFAVLRPSLLPGLVDAVSHNRRRARRDVRLFEIGSRFEQQRGEIRSIGCVWAGTGSAEHWSGTTHNVDFFDMKGVVERVGLAFDVQLTCAPADHPHLQGGRSARVRRSNAGNDENVGWIGLLAASTATARELPLGDEVYVAELDLAAFAATVPPDRRVEALPRFPSVVRDIAILVPDTLPAAELRGTIRAAAPDTLVELREFDRYQGKGIPDGSVSLAFHLTFQSPERTLTDAEVDAAMAAIVALLERTHGATRR